MCVYVCYRSLCVVHLKNCLTICSLFIYNAIQFNDAIDVMFIPWCMYGDKAFYRKNPSIGNFKAANLIAHKKKKKKKCFLNWNSSHSVFDTMWPTFCERIELKYRYLEWQKIVIRLIIFLPISFYSSKRIVVYLWWWDLSIIPPCILWFRS